MLSSCKVKLIDAELGIFMVRTSRTHCREILFALSCVTAAKGIHVTLRCLQTASTSRSCVESVKNLLVKGNRGTNYAAISVA
jgi:RNase P/RNase MRP subunit POP5